MSETKKVVVPLDTSNKELILPDELQESASASSEASSLSLPEDYADFYLDTKPARPLDSDCCGSGCKVCVVDIFEKQLKEWEDMRHQKWFKIKERHAENDKNYLSETTFRKYTLKEISQETKDTFRYHFAPVYSSNIQAGQHIILRACINGKTITRQYTPINLTRSNNSFELLIKIYPDGIMSKHLQTWKPGIEAEFRGPFGHFSMQLIAKFPKLFLLAAGTGIAPLSCIIESILQNEDDETFVHLLFACREYKDILMKEELDDWLDFYNFSSLCCLSQENVEAVRFCKEPLHFGRITKELLKTEITDLRNTYFLICGSYSFNKDMLNFLLDLKITESQYFIF